MHLGWPTGLVRLAALSALFVSEAGSAAVVAPRSVTIVYGRLIGGNAASLASLDSNWLQVCRYYVPNQAVAPVTMHVEATLPFTPTALSYRSVSRAETPGLYRQELAFFDWTKNAVDPDSDSVAVLGLGWLDQTSTGAGDLGRYVRKGDRDCMMVVRVRPVTPTSVVFWTLSYDLGVFAFP